MISNKQHEREIRQKYPTSKSSIVRYRQQQQKQINTDFNSVKDSLSIIFAAWFYLIVISDIVATGKLKPEHATVIFSLEDSSLPTTNIPHNLIDF